MLGGEFSLPSAKSANRFVGWGAMLECRDVRCEKQREVRVAAASADEYYKWQVPGSSRTGGGEDGIKLVQTKPRAVKVQQLSIGSDSDRIKRIESLHG
jgi:hypothetical protein